MDPSNNRAPGPLLLGDEHAECRRLFDTLDHRNKVSVNELDPRLHANQRCLIEMAKIRFWALGSIARQFAVSCPGDHTLWKKTRGHTRARNLVYNLADVGLLRWKSS